MWLTGDIYGIINWCRGKVRDLLAITNTSWTKSCMILTPSMATTTNNIQGDEPRPTALERQVQTLTAAVERFTRQNQTLEEQLRQKNTAMGNQEED